MLYLLGGSPRVGKTTLSKKFTSETGIPSFGLDYLKMGLARGLPELGVNPNGGDLNIAKQIWPIVKGMAMTYIENNEEYLLEGTYLLPEYVAELQQMCGNQIRSCFIGYAEIDTAEKVRHIREYGEQNDEMDWSSDNEEEAKEKVEFLKKFSVYIKTECNKYGLTYFENATDHKKAIVDIIHFLRT